MSLKTNFATKLKPFMFLRNMRVSWYRSIFVTEQGCKVQIDSMVDKQGKPLIEDIVLEGERKSENM